MSRIEKGSAESTVFFYFTLYEGAVIPYLEKFHFIFQFAFIFPVRFSPVTVI